MNIKYKSSIILQSSDETRAKDVAAWLSKLTKKARCTVRKRRLKSGVIFQVILRYASNIRPLTMFKIGYSFACYESGLFNKKKAQWVPSLTLEEMDRIDNNPGCDYPECEHTALDDIIS